MQETVQAWNEDGKRYGIMINAGKTKTTVFDCKDIHSKLTVIRIQLKIVEKPRNVPVRHEAR